MNWSQYSRFVGDIFGAPLALEALVAFFLESTFIGLWIFGWNRLPKLVHLAYWTAASRSVAKGKVLVSALERYPAPTCDAFTASIARSQSVS